MTIQARITAESGRRECGAEGSPGKNLRRKAKSLAKTVVDMALLPRLRAEKERLDCLHTMKGLIPTLCQFRGRWTIFANQEPGELSRLADRLLARPPKVVVEIGTARGGTLYLWSRIAVPGSLLVSIDKPGETGSVGKSTLAIYKSFGRDRGMQVFPIAGDSHSKSTHRVLETALGGKRVDFLFIDGDHTYEGVKQDFWGYRKYMASRGLIALHDIAVNPADPEIQVARFWPELQSQMDRTESFVTNPNRGPGIGLVFLN